MGGIVVNGNKGRERDATIWLGEGGNESGDPLEANGHHSEAGKDLLQYGVKQTIRS